MKKILTLAIALVMVFAIAAPAFAAGWDNPVDPEEFENLELDITALSVDYYAGAWNGAYQKLENTYPVVAGTKVHAYAEVTIPKEGDLSKDIATRIKTGKGLFKLTVSNLNVTDVEVYYDGVKSHADTSMKYVINDDCFGKTIAFEIWGTVKVSDKDAKITATLGVYNKFDDNNQFRFYAKDGKEYVIVHDGNNYIVTPNNDTDTGMIFQTNGDDQLEAAWVLLDATEEPDGEQYLIVDSFGEVRFLKVSDNTTATGKELEEVKAMMDQICNAMGFTYSGRAYMNEDLIEENLGTVVEGKDSLVYPTGYVQQLVTNDPSVKPPQTGDNASVVGFVMIAVALVAAAAVTVKKVRA